MPDAAPLTPDPLPALVEDIARHDLDALLREVAGYDLDALLHEVAPAHD